MVRVTGSGLLGLLGSCGPAVALGVHANTRTFVGDTQKTGRYVCTCVFSRSGLLGFVNGNNSVAKATWFSVVADLPASSVDPRSRDKGVGLERFCG